MGIDIKYKKLLETKLHEATGKPVEVKFRNDAQNRGGGAGYFCDIMIGNFNNIFSTISFGLTPVPSNCGIILFHSYVAFYPLCTSKIAKIIFEVIEKIAESLDFTVAIATTSDGELEYQTTFLKENGWTNLKEFEINNVNTGNDIHIWYKRITEKTYEDEYGDY
jgi:hypothetical protein